MFIQSLFGIAILSMLTGAFSLMTVNSQRNSKKVEIKVALIATKNYIKSAVESDEFWAVTMTHKKNKQAFRCALDPSKKCNKNSHFQLFDSAGRPFTERANRRPGFNFNQESCVGFNAQKGNEDCPIGVTLDWSRICAAPCDNNPRMRILVSFDYKSPINEIPFNPEFLNFEVIKNASGLSANVIAHDSIRDTDPGYTERKGDEFIRHRQIERIIDLPEQALLVVIANGKMKLQPIGGGESTGMKTRRHSISLFINDVYVTGNNTTTVLASPRLSENIAKRSDSLTWSKVIGPGPVKIHFRHTGSVTSLGEPLIYPEIMYSNISYSVFKN